MKPWRTVSRRVLVDRQPWFTVGDEAVELPDGRIVEDFGFIDMVDFAVIVPVTAAGDTILIRSYKHGIRAVSLSLPAGGLDGGEEPLACAQRELREETGFEADRWEPLGRFIVDPNRGCGAMHAFIAHGARKVAEPNSGDLEEQELLFVPMHEAIARMQAGEIVHLASAAALSLAVVALGPD